MDRSSEAGGGSRGQAELGRLLASVLSSLDLGPRFRERLAMKSWPEIAGPVVRSHTLAEGVQDGVLLVATDTPAWAQELQMRRGDLLERLAEQVGPGIIREIHFRSGLRRARRRGVTAAQAERPADIKLSRRQERKIRGAVANIEDIDLRGRAERAFLSLARMTAWRKRTRWRRCKRCGQWQRSGRRWCASCVYAGGARRGTGSLLRRPRRMSETK